MVRARPHRASVFPSAKKSGSRKGPEKVAFAEAAEFWTPNKGWKCWPQTSSKADRYLHPIVSHYVKGPREPPPPPPAKKQVPCTCTSVNVASNLKTCPPPPPKKKKKKHKKQKTKNVPPKKHMPLKKKVPRQSPAPVVRIFIRVPPVESTARMSETSTSSARKPIRWISSHQLGPPVERFLFSVVYFSRGLPSQPKKG